MSFFLFCKEKTSLVDNDKMHGVNILLILQCVSLLPAMLLTLDSF